MNIVFKRNFFTIVPQYMRYVRTNFGKFSKVCEPGVRLNIPIFHEMHEVDMRITTKSLESQEIITSDNVSCVFDSDVQYKVVNPRKAVMNVVDVNEHILTRSQLAIRSIISNMDVDDVLHKREILGKAILEELNDIEEACGVSIKLVQIKDIKFDESMKRAMAKTAEAERNGKAKIINAKADIETAKQYATASKVYEDSPISMRLREMQMLQSIARENGNSFFVVPSDILSVLKK